MTVRPLLHTGMHHTARTLFIGLALASAAGAASASGLYDYDKLLDAVDYPTGRAMFSGARWKGAAAAWPGNSALTWTEVTVPATADRSRTIRRFVAAATPLPASVLQFSRLNLDKATPEGSGAWQVYWTRDEITPVNGASTKRMYSTAQRRLVICETGKVVDGGAVRFAALDTSGDAFEVTLDFANPSVWDRALMAQDEGLREEFRVACASALVSAHGEEEGRRRLAQLTEPPAEPSPRQRAMAARQQVLEAVRATVQASAPESGASAAAATGPVGRAKARIRMFQQNGLEGGLTNEAACAGPNSTKEAGGGFWKALGSTVGVASNTAIGMPETETVRRLSDRSMIGSKAYFVESEVTADMPVTVDYGFGSAATGKSCGTLNFSFIPEAGADYEARMDVSAKYCVLMINRILPGGLLLPEPIERAPYCPPEKN